MVSTRKSQQYRVSRRHLCNCDVDAFPMTLMCASVQMFLVSSSVENSRVHLVHRMLAAVSACISIYQHACRLKPCMVTRSKASEKLLGAQLLYTSCNA